MFWPALRHSPLGGADSLRVALFTPLPPARTGTADYGASLANELRSQLRLNVFTRRPVWFRPRNFDLLVYEIANNPHHAWIYDLALRHPGVVALHETNLHHLIRHVSLQRGGEEAYRSEVDYEVFGNQARGHRLAGLDGVERLPHLPHELPMLRRLLERSRGCVVHSAYAEQQVRTRGFAGPISVIPHGAALTHPDGRLARRRLNIAEGVPLLGLFGYQRPDKRILECLKACAEVVQERRDLHILIVGEPHPEVPLATAISELGLSGRATVLGFVSLSEFDECLAACDVVLNTRHPTCGETSGTMMRAFGMGKTVIVSDQGAYREPPPEACVQVPCDEHFPAALRDCVRWLLADAPARARIGEGARQWVETECTWGRAAQRHAEFFSAVVEGRTASSSSIRIPETRSSAEMRTSLCRWIQPGDAETYFRNHLPRLLRTLERIPSGGPNSRLLELGCYLQMTPLLRDLLGYENVRGAYLGKGGKETRSVRSKDGVEFECVVDLFDAESDRFPYADGAFDTVLCCELLEHLERDPMHMLFEIHRVLKLEGTLVLTTPNAASLRALLAVLEGRHPGLYPHYVRSWPGQDAEPRHAREYTPGEISRLLSDAGFVVTTLETGPYGEEQIEGADRATGLLETQGYSIALRGDCMFAVARRAGVPSNRYPSWLYDG